MKDLKDTKWSSGWDLIEAYKPLASVKGWKKCKYCKCFPRVWEFNNGSFAGCKCNKKYTDSKVRSESILSYITRNNGSALNYPHDGLRKAWNHFIITNEIINLPKNQW
jgi:hypothetical protein